MMPAKTRPTRKPLISSQSQDRVFWLERLKAPFQPQPVIIQPDAQQLAPSISMKT